MCPIPCSFPYDALCLLSICSPFCYSDPDGSVIHGSAEIYRGRRLQGSPITLIRFYVSFKKTGVF